MNRFAVLSIFAFLFASPASAGEHKAFDCGTPAHKLQSKLPVTASAIRRGDDLVVVAIGSSSTSGAGASDATRTYPARLSRELQRRWPSLSITVLNKGVGGETSSQMIARFDRDVLAYNPDLVIWQSGTNSLLKKNPVEAYATNLHAGIAHLKRSHADIILMDPQYAPSVLASAAHMRMLETIKTAARETGVGLFPRFAIMEEWAQTGHIAMGDMVAPDNLHMNDASYACVARLLATGIAEAVRSAPMPMAVNTQR
jgi:lysophospholipase L1-like esterase